MSRCVTLVFFVCLQSSDKEKIDQLQEELLRTQVCLSESQIRTFRYVGHLHRDALSFRLSFVL